MVISVRPDREVLSGAGGNEALGSDSRHKVHISTWYSNDLPRDWVIALSEKGWTNDQLGLLWLTTVFEPYTAP
ncbi:hypothetical protein IFR05_015964, partial [Cadophora sp. M221]